MRDILAIVISQFLVKNFSFSKIFRLIQVESFFLLRILFYSRRVEEFKEYGDMDTMMQYVKEVQSVQKKLSECVDAIGFINEVLLRSYIWLCALWF